jgi:hypothetical protein
MFGEDRCVVYEAAVSRERELRSQSREQSRSDDRNRTANGRDSCGERERDRGLERRDEAREQRRCDRAPAAKCKRDERDGSARNDRDLPERDAAGQWCEACRKHEPGERTRNEYTHRGVAAERYRSEHDGRE